MTEEFTKWDSADYLKTPEDIRHYLDACIEDDPGDGSLIRHALGAIARAQNMSQLARKVGMSREGLYKALSDNGNPSFTVILKVAKALGLKMKLTPAI